MRQETEKKFTLKRSVRRIFFAVCVITLVTAGGFNLPEGGRESFHMQGYSPVPGAPLFFPVQHNFMDDLQLSRGRFLVAARQLKDPNFFETVILLIEYSRDGAMGLIVNRPTDIALSEVLPELKKARRRRVSLFLGGPVEVNQLFVLTQSDHKPKDSLHVFKDVYIGFSLEALQDLVEKKKVRGKFHVYAGYAGWAPGQLDYEVFRGDWHIVPADSESIFLKPPKDVWSELIGRGQGQWTKNPKPAADERVPPGIPM
jgi:putative transcriptional regulator